MGEKSTKYFHSLEKRNQENKHIKTLVTDDNQTLWDMKEILKEEVRFYQKLYSSTRYIDPAEFNQLFDRMNLTEIDMGWHKNVNYYSSEEKIELAKLSKTSHCGTFLVNFSAIIILFLLMS